MTKQKAYFNGELGQRFGYRKLTVGLCSVVLGSFLLTTNNQQVKADTITDNANSKNVVSNSESGVSETPKQASVVAETKPASDSVNSTVMKNSANGQIVRKNSVASGMHEQTRSAQSTNTATQNSNNGATGSDASTSTNTNNTDATALFNPTNKQDVGAGVNEQKDVNVQAQNSFAVRVRSKRAVVPASTTQDEPKLGDVINPSDPRKGDVEQVKTSTDTYVIHWVYANDDPYADKGLAGQNVRDDAHIVYQNYEVYEDSKSSGPIVSSYKDEDGRIIYVTADHSHDISFGTGSILIQNDLANEGVIADPVITGDVGDLIYTNGIIKNIPTDPVTKNGKTFIAGKAELITKSGNYPLKLDESYKLSTENSGFNDFTGSSENQLNNIYIYYYLDTSKEKFNVKAKYVDADDNDKLVTEKDLTGKLNDQVAVPAPPENYIIDSSSPNSLLFDKDHVLAPDSNPYIIKLRHKKITDSENKNVTREVTITDPSGKKSTTTQTVTFKRDATVDMVTNKVTYGNWSENGKHTFAQVDVPPISGYTASGEVPAIVVTPDTQSSTVNITYIADKRTLTINFIDTFNNANTPVGQPQTIDGKVDTDISLSNVVVPTGYVLADGVTIPPTYHVTVALDQHLDIKLTHGFSKQPVNNDHLSDPTLGDHDFTRTITIKGVPDQDDKTITQHVHFHRDGYRDLTDPNNESKIKWGAWQTTGDPNFVGQTINPIAGYTMTVNGQKQIEPKVIKSITVTPDTKPSDVQKRIDVVFNADDQSVVYNFVDDNDPEHRTTVESITKTGVTGGKLNFDVDLSGKLFGYTLENPSDAKQSYTFGATNAPIAILLKHNIQGVDKDHIPVGYSKDDFTHTVNRVVTITTPDGKSNTTTQSHTFNRDGKYDAVTKQIAWNPWSDNDNYTFDAVPIPSEPGYKASGSADATVVHHDTSDSKLDITFKALGQSVTVNYVDGSGATVKSMTLTGTTGQTIDLDLGKNMPANWKTTNPDQQSSYTFNADNSQVQNIEIEHQTRKDPDDTTTVSRKVIIYLPGHQLDTEHSTTQTATFKRSAIYDYVLKHEVYGQWSEPQKFAEIDLPDIEGYDTPKIASVPVTANDPDTTLTTEYTPKGYNVKITYKDENGNQIGDPQIISGKTGEDKQIDYNFPKNWEAVDDKDLPKDYHFDANPDKNKPISVTIKHKLADPKDESVTVSRDIEIDVPNSKPQNVHQTITFIRTNHTDLVTGKTVNGKWSENGKHTFDSINVPVIKGYAPSSTVPAITVTADGGNQNILVHITYIAGGQTNSYQFVDDDENGKAVNGGAQFAGKTGETVQLHIDKAPDDYDFASEVPGSYTFKAEDNQPLTIHLKHHMLDASSDPNAETSRVFTRNITITNPDGKAANITQTVKFTRSAAKDAITGNYKYGTWSNDGKGKFDAYPIKVIDGYDIINKDTGEKLDSVSEVAIDADKSAKIINVNVVYKALDQASSWAFHDDDNKTGKPSTIEAVHNLTGKTDESVPLNVSLPENYVVKGYSYGENGQLQTGSLPSQYKFAGSGNEPLIIHLGHKTADVSTANGDKGIDDSRTITRTVIIESPNGKETTEKQSVVFTRPATKDLVTGDINYGKWNHDTQQMPEMTLPAVPGYSQDVKVPEITVTPDSKPSSITVHYMANDSQQTIIYQDKNGKEVGTQVVKGKTDEKVPFTPDFPKGYINKEVPKTITIPAVDKPITVKVDPVVTTVHIDPNHPVEKGQIIPGTDVEAPAGLGKNDLNKDITRHIVISMPDGTNKTIDQTVHAQRGATINLNTKKITYDPWMVVGKDSFDPVEMPKVDGYTPSVNEIAGVEHVDPNKDYGDGLNVHVTYTKNKEIVKDTDNNNNSGYIDNNVNTTPINTDPTLNDGKFSGLNRGDLNNAVDIKAGQGHIKHHVKSDKLGKALLKKGRKYGKRNSRNGRNGDRRGYGYGRGYGQNGYGNYGAGNGPMNAISSGINGYNANGAIAGANANSNNGNDTNTSSSLMNTASGQYGNSDLPQTGNNQNYAVIALGLATIAMSFGLAYRKKRYN